MLAARRPHTLKLTLKNYTHYIVVSTFPSLEDDIENADKVAFFQAYGTSGCVASTTLDHITLHFNNSIW